jgi:hypothetical protein
MRIYYKNYFDNTSHIEAPCPIPSRSNIVVDVKYAFDAYGSFNDIRPQKHHQLRKLYNKLTASTIKQFLLLTARRSFNHAKNRTVGSFYRHLQERVLTYVSISGLVHSVSEDATVFQPGDPIAAIGFLQPAIADYVIVSAQLAVKLSNASDITLQQSSLLLIGGAASYILHQCLRLRTQNSTVNHVFLFRDSLFTDILASMLRACDFSVHTYPYDNDVEHPTITPNCLLCIFGMDSPYPISDVRQHISENTLTYFCLDHNNSPHSHGSANIFFISIPKPWTQHNLNMYSDSPLDLPEWCEQRFLHEYISFIEKRPDSNTHQTQPTIA